MQEKLKKYLRLERLPHIWCPGCGNGILLGAFVRAVGQLGLDQNNTVVVSGIGCSSRATGYLDFNTLHTTHGRALAFATGIKVARPEASVFVLMGDGDAAAIGGNHLIHAARRNIDITAIIFNNSIYGMTGGQYSPLTPQGSRATTAPHGLFERPFDLAELAKAAGATYVARATTYHTGLLTRLIKAGAGHKGFSLIEVITACPVSYGRRNRSGSAYDMLVWQKEHGVPVEKAAKMKPEEMRGKFLIGELHRAEAPEYTEAYERFTGELQRSFKGE
ncbi:MAG: 2-oxoacid:ferredoxin oxidoreductase subunit beta [Pelotomaculum sp.]|uniref:Pyruvate:ferredoxin oxidoreductase and related 2-oxoacid:ferredoxin oxidoreductases, beta subunit n=1 Tax=Pelotomaculum thermopropionicum (strain DSM 13744 / JCM 10971 / SI) TaxID=370438 RepID=A5D423_PELTS|nr:2-oxoacid:ferredoxin oxidoreductase subunit beta [Pelotomaculum sp.]BAF59027.1 pyruvate:ferredoxin oxidoreductase and related 2-oxoacid:ferredoxin oxidoreductases, beta subunit [Pelotomaculum thermopropionicum SI]